MNHTVKLSNGIEVPAIGQGTWYLGDDPLKRNEEIEAIRTGIDAGMTLIDTAEMYGSGRSESLVGEAIKGIDRQKLFLVSKVLPSNAGRKNMEKSCDASLRRMGTDYLDLYLYHWRGGIPLRETVECLEALKQKGKIKEWGVSNLDTDDMLELSALPGGKNCLVDQVLYHMGSRGIEFDLLPYLVQKNITLMSYCPLAQAGTLRRGLFENKTLKQIAQKHEATVPQILLAWNIRNGHTIAIPRTGNPAHTIQNANADKIELDVEDLTIIDDLYEPPVHKEYLDMQ